MNKLLFLVGWCLAGASWARASHTLMAGNPVFPAWYADLEGIIFNDQYKIYPTCSAPFEEQVGLDACSSPDLVRRTRHARLIDTAAVTWAKRAMWAPTSA